MKKSILWAVASLICLTLCTPDKEAPGKLSDAVLTDYDRHECPCCGGLMINFDNDSIPYSGSYYLIDQPSPALDNYGKARFPVFLKVRWIKEEDKCFGQYIKITWFELK